MGMNVLPKDSTLR